MESITKLNILEKALLNERCEEAYILINNIATQKADELTAHIPDNRSTEMYCDKHLLIEAECARFIIERFLNHYLK